MDESPLQEKNEVVSHEEKESLIVKEEELLDDKSGKVGDNSEKRVTERKDRIKIWLKDRYNLIFLAILGLAIYIALHYFNITKSQPLWWDEADYLAYAKTLAGFPTNWIVTNLHNSLFPFIAAVFFKIGFSTAGAKFFLEFIPLIIVIFLSYKISILMYKDKRIALITMFLMSTFWAVLFNSMRFHLGIPALMFAFFGIYVFFQGHERKEKIFGKISYSWAIPITVFFVMLTYATRRGYFLFGVIFFVYLLLTKDIKSLIKDKYNWIGLAVFLVMLFIIEKFIFISSISELTAYAVDDPFNLSIFQVFGAYFYNISSSFFSTLYYLFWAGAIVIALNVFLNIGLIKKSKNISLRSDIFVLSMILITLFFFFMTVTRALNSFGEPRWYFPLLLGSLICIARGTTFIADHIKKYNKIFAIFFIVAVIGYGGYYEVQHADMIIKSRVNSYSGVMKASLFIKDVSNPGDAIIGKSGPQVSFYSERKFSEPDKYLNPDPNNITLDDFLNLLNSPEGKDIRYLLITITENGYPIWMKKVQYEQNSLVKLEIPFMNSSIDFRTGEQKLAQSAVYDNVEFRLLHIVEDAFVYEIVRT